MDKAGLSEKPSDGLSRMGSDIPQAVRDVAPGKVGKGNAGVVAPSKMMGMIGGLVGAAIVALGSGVWLALQSPQVAVTGEPATPSPANNSPTPAPAASPTAENAAPEESLLGHLPYEEAPPEELQVVSGDIMMRQKAAQAFLQMQEAARAEGVNLALISGFRNQKDQEHLFFDVKAERAQVATQRAEVSAPPGYSEHHTGYAMDVGDGDVPATDLSVDFENTRAFKWMQANAARYSFELSFPKNNVQGVSYEPWHWRFVGDRHSLETFYKARLLQPSPSQPASEQVSNPNTVSPPNPSPNPQPNP